MNEAIEISYKFEPLFELLDDNAHPEVDTVVLTGGRGSSKSFNVSLLSLIGVVEHNWKVLYTRFTNTSIGDSIKEEVSSKIELLGYESKLIDNKYSIETHTNKGGISFKGIKTSSNGQTANLKSLSGFNCFIVDEAEEIPSYKTFKKVFYSIRSGNKRNISILILNPSTKDHWIYQELFEKYDIPDGFCGIKNNILYIHSSYKDVNPAFIPSNIKEDYERLRLENEDEYNNVVMGGWRTDIEGALLPLSKLLFTPTHKGDDNLVANIAISDPADGGGDKLSTIFLKLVFVENKLSIYVQDVVHSTNGIGGNVVRVAERIKNHNTERILVEGNGVGRAMLYELRRELEGVNCIVEGYNERMPKDGKIIGYYEFVRDNFFFNEEYKTDPDYKLFINDLISYEKEGNNAHKKDAIDVCCAAAKYIKVRYNKLIYK